MKLFIFLAFSCCVCIIFGEVALVNAACSTCEENTDSKDGSDKSKEATIMPDFMIDILDKISSMSRWCKDHYRFMINLIFGRLSNSEIMVKSGIGGIIGSIFNVMSTITSYIPIIKSLISGPLGSMGYCIKENTKHFDYTVFNSMGDCLRPGLDNMNLLIDHGMKGLESTSAAMGTALTTMWECGGISCMPKALYNGSKLTVTAILVKIGHTIEDIFYIIVGAIKLLPCIIYNVSTTMIINIITVMTGTMNCAYYNVL